MTQANNVAIESSQINSSGVLQPAGGGTGASSLTANNVLLGNGTSAVQTVAPGTSGNLLTSNGTTWVSQAAPSGMVYPGAGIANSTGTSWGTSYTTTGSGTVVALATSPSFTTPVLGTPTSGTLTNCTGLPVGGISATGTPSSSTYLRGDGSWQSVSVSPAGSNTYVQYNNSGAFGASSSFTFDGTTLIAPVVKATQGFHTNPQTNPSSYTVPSSTNAMSVGPFTVATGTTVTVSTGSRWVIV